MIKNDCKLSMEILRTKLALIITNQDIVAPLLPLKLGIFVRVMGEILYTYKCKQLDLMMATVPECTNEMLVMMGQTIRYVEPVTRVLLAEGSVRINEKYVD